MYIHVCTYSTVVVYVLHILGEQRPSSHLQEPASSGWCYHVGPLSVPAYQGHSATISDHERAVG